MFEVHDDDIALLPMSPAARENLVKIECSLKDLTKRLDARDSAIERLEARLAHIERTTKSFAK